MNLLFCCIGKRGYLADYFRLHLRPGERIIGTSHTPWTPGFAACDVGLVVPPIASDEYVPTILDICRTHDVGGLLSLFDPDVVALAEHRDAFVAAGVVPMIPSARAAWIGYDKWQTFQTLSAAGFAVPDTTSDLEEARRGLVTGRFRYPLIVKPRYGFGSADVFVARNERQLEAFFTYRPDMLIQEFEDGDAYDIETLSDLDRRVVHATAWRKLLSRHGETEHAMTVNEPGLLDLGRRLAEAVGVIGPMDVDLFRTRQGQWRVLELNLRFGGGYPLSHLAGADFPSLIVEMCRGGRPAPQIGNYKIGVCMLKGVTAVGGPSEQFLECLRAGTYRSHRGF